MLQLIDGYIYFFTSYKSRLIEHPKSRLFVLTTYKSCYPIGFGRSDVSPIRQSKELMIFHNLFLIENIMIKLAQLVGDKHSYENVHVNIHKCTEHSCKPVDTD